jgi:hypothetical protein
MVSLQGLELSSSRHLDGSLEVLDRCYHLILARQQLNPHVSTHIIHEEKKVAFTTWSCWSDGPAQVTMN